MTPLPPRRAALSTTPAPSTTPGRRRARGSTRVAILLIVLACSPTLSWRGRADAAGQPVPGQLATTDAAFDDGCHAELRPADLPAGCVGMVEGALVFLTEVDERIAGELLEIDDQVAAARERELELQINGILLEQEAARRGVTSAELLEREVRARVEVSSERLDRQRRAQREEARAREFAARLRAAADVVGEARAEAVDGDAVAAADPARVLARVNGAPITAGDVERQLAPLRAEAARRVHRLRRESLDVIVNDRLVEREAARLGESIGDLLRREIARRARRVSELDARRYYDLHRARLPADARTPVGVQRVVAHLRERERTRAALAYADELRRRADIRIWLPAPEEPVIDFDDSGQPQRGAPGAEVVLQVFLDFQCGSCAWLHEHLEELLERFAGELRVVARDLPLDRHERAQAGARAAEAARHQGRYWEFARELFRRQGRLDDASLRELASDLGLDADRFDRDRASAAVADGVARDRREALRLGVDATPAIFVDGVRVRIGDEHAVRRAVEAALSKTPRASGTSPRSRVPRR